MKKIPLYWLPPIELSRFKKIDYFPPRPQFPQELERAETICIGTKNRTIGDALVLSTLPRKLAEKYPNLKIYTYPRGFNRAVFHGNPWVSGVRYLPDRLYGDDANWGSGHLIQLKERFFELPVSDVPRPEVFLDPAEKVWAERYLQTGAKKIVAIHAWGHTRKSVASPDFWQELVRRFSDRFDFLQLGVAGQLAIPGCKWHFLAPRRFRSARNLFALMSRASFFVGVDSGPMHVARAFDVPSFLLLEHHDPKEAFEARWKHPYFYNKAQLASSFLYEENTHLYLPGRQPKELFRTFEDWVEAAGRKGN